MGVFRVVGCAIAWIIIARAEKGLAHPPGAARVLDFRVLWRNVATREQAYVTVRAWNADTIQKPVFKNL